MNNAWNTYKEALLERMPFLAETLGAGVSEDDIRAAEAETGIAFPAELAALYRTNNGDDHEAACGMILGFHFLSLDELRSEWRRWKEYAEDAERNAESHFTSVPAGCIKRRYADAKWIPFCSDDGGNFIGIDLDPDVSGRAGQIINFGRDEHSKLVLAADLNAFFERLTRIVLSDDFFVVEDEFVGEEVVYLGSADEDEAYQHLTDYLKSEDAVQ